jgi:hypothetical protein
MIRLPVLAASQQAGQQDSHYRPFLKAGIQLFDPANQFTQQAQAHFLAAAVFVQLRIPA